jgi:dienelactone hydrolase
MGGCSPTSQTVPVASISTSGAWRSTPANTCSCTPAAPGCTPARGLLPDGRTIAVLASGDRPLDVDLVLVDVASGAAVTPLPHPDEAALVGSPAWLGGASFAVASSVGHDFMATVRHELGSGATVALPGAPLDVDTDVVSSRDGSTLLLIENRDGAAVMTLRDAVTGAVRVDLATPEPGVVSGLFDSPILSRWHAGVLHAVDATDAHVGVRLRCPHRNHPPSHRRAGRYASLDDTTKRLDTVADLAAVHGFLDQAGFDPARAALWGGSYGGYMVLAGVAFSPELWAAGVDIVGISDLVTFLQNTSDYRRAHREREYGSLAHDRAFLEAASPMRRVEAIRAPLFVIHGRNDPRVPVSEAEQLVADLSDRGIRCELRIYEDEGHGLARLANRLDAYPAAVEFLHDVLGS